MSFETKEVVARLEAIEREMGELKQNATIISLAIVKLTHVVDAAVNMLEGDDEQRRVDENLAAGKCPDGCCDLPEASYPVSGSGLNEEFPESSELRD